MIAIVDYGVGNLFSLKSSFEKIGADVILTSDAETIQKSDRIVLPGVGAFADAAAKLRSLKLDQVITDQAKLGKNLLGICLGMQLLFDKSYEFGEHEGLGLIGGDIVPLEGAIADGLKIPHIGWNSLKFTGEKSEIFKYINDGDYVYFVHSFYASNCQKFVSATTDYGAEITASAQNKNVYGCQFHPEKSGDVGLSILKAFCELEDRK